MTQQPFSETGVQDKQKELYDLSDNDLSSTAGDIRSDFKRWVRTNFSLTPDQDSYLESIGGGFLRALTSETSSAIENRFPIILIITRDTGTVGGSKLFGLIKSLDAKYDKDGTNEVSGKLTLNMVYPK